MIAKPKNLYGLILAGGYSRRMGQDKAVLDYHGQTQIAYTHGLLSALCDKVFLSIRPNQSLLEHYRSFIQIQDDQEFNNIGPLAGILSAMKMYPKASWIVLACDLPFVTKDTLSYLIKNREITKIATAYISKKDGLPEPLCAIWEQHGYEHIKTFIQDSIKCPRKILINSDTHLLKQTNEIWLENINNQQEWINAQKLAK